MDTNRNHLVTEEYLKTLDQKDQENYEPVPGELTEAAMRKLAGKQECYVSKTSGGKLSRWAASKRKKKRQQAKAARRKNRGF